VQVEQPRRRRAQRISALYQPVELTGRFITTDLARFCESLAAL
jgi:hypothetical protein